MYLLEMMIASHNYQMVINNYTEIIKKLKAMMNSTKGTLDTRRYNEIIEICRKITSLLDADIANPPSSNTRRAALKWRTVEPRGKVETEVAKIEKRIVRQRKN